MSEEEIPYVTKDSVTSVRFCLGGNGLLTFSKALAEPDVGEQAIPDLEADIQYE